MYIKENIIWVVLIPSGLAWENKCFSSKNRLNYLLNPSLYIFQKDGLILAFAIYVDDLMLIGNHNAKLKWVRDELCSQFDMFLLGLSQP